MSKQHIRWIIIVVGMVIFTGCSSAAGAKKAAASSEVWLLDAGQFSSEEKLAAYTLQGLANRTEPRMFIRLGIASRWMGFDYRRTAKTHGPLWNPQVIDAFEKKYPSIEDYWVEYLSRDGRFRFKPTTLAELIGAMGSQLKGCILYESIKTDCSAVCTLAGLEDAVPLTPSLRTKLVAEGVNLPVVFDYVAVRSTFSKDRDLRLEAHRWALDKLLPQCHKDGLISRDRTYGLDEHDSIMDIDLAVQNRWFVYDLNHAATENNPVNPVKVNPIEKALLDELLSQITPFSPVYGWGRPGEENFIRSLNRHKLLGICSSVPNNSFFARLPAPATSFKQRGGHRNVNNVDLEPDKVYVAFLVNEGDTLKTANGLMGVGSWIQPERGTLPLNWGIDPLFNRHFPALMAYYYATMSDNDYFFAATSGWGYAHPSFLPSDSLLAYGKLVKQGGELADVRYIDIWHVNLLRKSGLFHPFLQATGMKGLTDWDGNQQSVTYTDYGLTIIKSDQYYTLDDPKTFATMLVDDIKSIQPPWFIVVYGARGHGTPYKFSEVAKRLPTDRFKIVKLDEFFSAAEKAKAQMQKRVWKPDPNAPKGVAP